MPPSCCSGVENGKKIKYFEALGVGVPGAGPETPEDVQEEPEAETLLGTDIEI